MQQDSSKQFPIFAGMSTKDKIDSLEVVTSISEEDILDAVAAAFPKGSKRLQQMLIDRQESLKVIKVVEQFEDLLNKKAGSLTAGDVEPYRTDYFMLPQYIQETIKQANPNIEKEIWASDLAIFCRIGKILLDGGKLDGKIKQRQMWDQLKVHGFVKKLWGTAEPEALTTTLNRHQVTKQSTLHTTLQETVQASDDKKMSIEQLQKKYCPK